MSKYYRPLRTRNIFDPNSTKPFKLSRSKIELFLNCPACFYLDRRVGVNLPPGYPFSLNSAVDSLLKTEFDKYRSEKSIHPLCKKHGIDVVPFQHPDMDKWRNSLQGGVVVNDKKRNLIITGGVDDIWENRTGYLHVVDYKATSKVGNVTIDEDWQIGYKRQIEIYQWLLRGNGHKVSDIGYFVYCNGDSQRGIFDGEMKFTVDVIPYKGNDDWVGNTLDNIVTCLKADDIPQSNSECDFCAYFTTRTQKQ